MARPRSPMCALFYQCTSGAPERDSCHEDKPVAFGARVVRTLVDAADPQISGPAAASAEPKG